jgi:hypothetical protein
MPEEDKKRIFLGESCFQDSFKENLIGFSMYFIAVVEC